jgi:hypothetical protein
MIIISRKRTFLFKIFVWTIIILGTNSRTFAQQFSLYNSRTLYDSFENPSQRAYQVDTSRRFAFNFFIPAISINSSFSGPAQNAFKILLYDGMFNGRDITIGDKLMGDDSTPRNVLELFQGKSKMYRISPIKGDSFLFRLSNLICLTNASID